MRNTYLLLAGFGLLLTSLTARAQQPWQPFRPGVSYQFSEAATPGDTTHVLRLGAGTPVAGSPTDTLFQFNARVRQVARANANTCASHLRVVPDNLFGATLRSQPGSVFELVAANGRRLVLRPHAATGQAWATGLPGLTASVAARTLEAVLGSAPDSVVAIGLSDGQTLRLSKRYGWLNGPSLDSYLNGRNPRRVLTLTALPERGLGTAATGTAAVYDFQPGDIFQYTTNSYVNGGASQLCQTTWQQDSVLTRGLSANGDTLLYTVRRRQRSQGFGSTSTPPGIGCSTPSTSVLYPPTTVHIRVPLREAAASWLPRLTNYFQFEGTVGGYYASVACRNATRLAGRPETTVLNQVACRSASPDSVYLTDILDFYTTNRYAVGLGKTYENLLTITYQDITELTAYAKGSERWGTFFKVGTLLPVRATAPARTTAAFPSPFGERLTASFELSYAQLVTATLRDALGRVVYAAPAAPLPAGPRQLVLPTAGLPAGLYLLQLQFAGEGRSEVLRVVKAE